MNYSSSDIDKTIFIFSKVLVHYHKSSLAKINYLDC